ncbi:MAG TPA: hypothetical protein DCX07_10320 [Phycisphaerales bacterium]|nr:hypothetical protein [Phycisphaerales bacterium]
MRAKTSHPNPALRGRWFHAGESRPNVLYRLMRRVFQVFVTAFWKVRVFQRFHEPAQGGAVYICNHQSFMDPILMSFALRRPMSYMARDSLFRFPLFGRVIQALNAFPVRRGTADTGALKEAMRRLKGGGQVVVFAEGTRTRDGRIGPMLPGVAMLAQRAAEWTVPVLIDGAFEAWPRTQALPSPGSIVVRYAPPLSREQTRAMTPEQLMDTVRKTLIEMQADVRRQIGRPALRYD